ncbi:MAG: hypothetical protein KBC06_00710 [Candidatus Pacebacteria bacterium]|nr:hypothetical protein [Candidatus Paceibacterota bacterium]
MKKIFTKLSIPSLLLALIFGFSNISSAQVPLGTCTLPSLASQGATAPGYPEDQCYADGGTWVADSPAPNNAVPINTGNPSPNPNTNTNTNSSATTKTPYDGKGLVPCKTSANPGDCDFNAFMNLINTVIQFLLFKMALPIAAIMFAYAGVLMVTSGGSTESMSKAKGIFVDVVKGLVIAVASWLIIRTILLIVGYNGSWIGF